MSPRELALSAVTGAEAAQIGTWRYPPPYDTYDPSDDVAAIADPANRFLSLKRDDELIGYVCFAAEARVRGLDPEPGAEDIGWGLRPDLVGRGESRILLPWIVERVGPALDVLFLRVVIAAWNARSLAAAERTGFERVGEHHTDDDVGHYLLLTRQIA